MAILIDCLATAITESELLPVLFLLGILLRKAHTVACEIADRHKLVIGCQSCKSMSYIDLATLLFSGKVELSILEQIMKYQYGSVGISIWLGTK